MDAHRGPSTLDRLAAVTPPPLPPALDEAERERARAELHAYYRQRFGRIDLRGLTLAAGAGVHAPSVELDDVYQPLEAVEIDATGAPAPAWHPISMAAGSSLFEPDVSRPMALVRVLAEPAPLEELLARPRRRPALVLGGPGAGKSCFLRRCAVAGSSDAPLFGIDDAVPVYLPLAVVRAAPARPLIEHAIELLRAEGLAIAGVIAAEAEAGRAVFLLDGLDEVGDAVQPVADAVAALAAAYPDARIVVTSRPVGLHGVALAVDHLQLDGLGDEQIVALVTRWCELDERRRSGDDAAELGVADGSRLARRILATPALHDLAACPLAATFVALVHRGGGALAEHRVELFDRALELYAARWNQARATGVDGVAPLAAADVRRLLGPIGLAMVERGRGAIDAASLRALIDDALAGAERPDLGGADAVLASLRDDLGLVVERAPGLVGLAHESLAELLAAFALVDDDGLEQLLADPARAFAPRWHEVVRFGLAAIGTLAHAEARLDGAVRLLVEQATAARATPSPVVPELLGAILVDDPDLTPELATAIADELVPAWWFDGTPAFDGEHAGTALAQRILAGPWARPLAIALARRYRDGWGEGDAAGGLRGRIGPLGLLRKLGASQPLLLCEALVAAMAHGEPPPPGPQRFMPLLQIPLPAEDAFTHLQFTLRISGLAVLLREGCGRLFFATVPGSATDGSWIELEDGAGTRMIGRRLDAPPPESFELSGTIHIAVAEHPDPALLPNVLAAWHELASRYPEAGPQPPATVDDAIARYGAIDVN